MDIVVWLEQIMIGFGAGWVMWLMLALSVVSVAIILERAWFFHSLRDDLTVLAREFRTALDTSIEAARRRLERSPSAEAAVVTAGLSMVDRGTDAVEQAMTGAAALQRLKLERRLAYLATVGNNAPFIGLFGTVIGIIGAFKALGEQAKVPMAEAATAALAPQAVMSAISEALVATAVGIAIAIPAVAANNYFQRQSKSILANTEALSSVLLAYMLAEPAALGGAPASAPRSGRPAKAPASKRTADEPEERAAPPSDAGEEG
jgi:biopolymer transport protein ExbB